MDALVVEAKFREKGQLFLGHNAPVGVLFPSIDCASHTWFVKLIRVFKQTIAIRVSVAS